MVQSQTSRPSLIVRSLSGIIRLYQLQSPLWGRRCRFYPSCSEYMRETLLTVGFWKGMKQGILRILKCHPWHPGGVDFVRSYRGE